MKTGVLILGGGLAGLSTAYHLERRGWRDYRLLEKNARPGGRAGTEEKDGFLFDHTGHLLHLHDPYGKRLILDLLKGNHALHKRSSWIYSHGTYTRYPFQANTYGLPPRVVEDCVAGFLKNVHRPARLGAAPSFREWSLAAFGEGISRHFLFPYNRKLWRTPLSEMTTDWQGRFLPRPSAEEVLYGAWTDQKKFFGYNAAFRYPVRGGIQALPDALAARVGGLSLGARVVGIDLLEKVATVEGMGELRYEKLVSTLPLTELLDMASDLPAPVREARRRLRYVSVHNLNLGVGRPRVSEKHWIYFPERRFPFYRVGFGSNFSANLGPRDTSSLYVEISGAPGRRPDYGALERRCLDALKSCGLLRPSERLLARLWIPIECAYVVYDRARGPALRTIFPYLASRDVECIGRWGAWKYSFMEEAVLDGKRCAERLLGKRSEEEAAAPSEPLK